MNKTSITVKRESFLMSVFKDEDYINSKLEDLGFDLENTTWIYSWTVPGWVSDEKKKYIEKKLSDSNYTAYLINVRQETLG